MKEGKKVERFGAIPFRAFGDRRIHGLPLAILGVIAAHDCFGKNGQGCTASHRRLADLASCRREAVTHALGLLEEYGYVQAEVHPRDGRKRTYKVIYNDQDRIAFRPSSTRRAALLGLHRLDALGVLQHTEQKAIGALERTDFDALGAPENTDRGIAKTKNEVKSDGSRRDEQAQYISKKTKEPNRSLPSQGQWGCGAKAMLTNREKPE
jgi:hypothetical protein